MSHEITERADGTAVAAFALTPAWHGLGTVLDHAMSSQEALTAAQLDWEVVQRPMAIGTPRTIETPDGPTETLLWEEYPTVKVNVRDDNNLFLGLVSERYTVVQNTEAFQFVDALVEEGQMQYESAFSLAGGRRVVLLARLPDVDYITDDDALKRYILMSLTHDGTGAIKFGPCNVRVVCANTYAIALKEGTVRDLTIRHTGRIDGKLEEARGILSMANTRFDEHSSTARDLAAKKMTTDEWATYLDVMCPRIPKEDPDYTELRAKRISETRSAITDCYHNDRQRLPGIAGSAWAAFNAVTEHIDHLPRRGATPRQKAETRFNVTLAGPGRDMKARAFDAACRIAGIVTAS